MKPVPCDSSFAIFETCRRKISIQLDIISPTHEIIFENWQTIGKCVNTQYITNTILLLTICLHMLIFPIQFGLMSWKTRETTSALTRKENKSCVLNEASQFGSGCQCQNHAPVHVLMKETEMERVRGNCDKRNTAHTSHKYGWISITNMWQGI